MTDEIETPAPTPTAPTPPPKRKRQPRQPASVSKPFYQSASFWSAVLMVAGFLFKSLAVDVEVRDALAGALATIGGAGMLWGRWRARGPLTATRTRKPR